MTSFRPIHSPNADQNFQSHNKEENINKSIRYLLTSAEGIIVDYLGGKWKNYEHHVSLHSHVQSEYLFSYSDLKKLQIYLDIAKSCANA